MKILDSLIQLGFVHLLWTILPHLDKNWTWLGVDAEYHISWWETYLPFMFWFLVALTVIDAIVGVVNFFESKDK